MDFALILHEYCTLIDNRKSDVEAVEIQCRISTKFVQKHLMQTHEISDVARKSLKISEVLNL